MSLGRTPPLRSFCERKASSTMSSIAAISRACGTAVVAVMSNQLVYKFGTAGGGTIHEQLRDPTFGLFRNEQDFHCGLESQQGNK